MRARMHTGLDVDEETQRLQALLALKRSQGQLPTEKVAELVSQSRNRQFCGHVCSLANGCDTHLSHVQELVSLLSIEYV